MCKPRVECDTSDQHKTQNMNLGLVNMSKNGDGLDVSDIVIYVICAISVIMVLKWLKKCYNRKVRQAQNIIQPVMPPTMPPVQQQALYSFNNFMSLLSPNPLRNLDNECIIDLLL